MWVSHQSLGWSAHARRTDRDHAGGPRGTVLTKVCGDVEQLNHELTALEAAYGLARRSAPVLVLATGTAEAMFQAADH